MLGVPHVVPALVALPATGHRVHGRDGARAFQRVSRVPAVHPTGYWALGLLRVTRVHLGRDLGVGPLLLDKLGGGLPFPPGVREFRSRETTPQSGLFYPDGLREEDWLSEIPLLLQVLFLST